MGSSVANKALVADRRNVGQARGVDRLVLTSGNADIGRGESLLSSPRRSNKKVNSEGERRKEFIVIE